MLSLDERTRLVAAIAQLYDFTEGPRSRRVLLEQAGLRRFVTAIDLSGTPGTVAGNLVGLLEAFGPLPERPTHDALGALLAYLLRLPDLPRDAAAQIARIIVVHGLIGDPGYVGELRATYGVTDAVAPAAPAIAVAPSPGVTAAPAPAFVADVPNPKALERVINSEDNFLDIFLLSGAVYSAQAVCRIERPRGNALGTGFLVGADLLLTNQHVLSSAAMLDDACARFGYQVDATTVAAAVVNTASYRASTIRVLQKPSTLRWSDSRRRRWPTSRSFQPKPTRCSTSCGRGSTAGICRSLHDSFRSKTASTSSSIRTASR